LQSLPEEIKAYCKDGQDLALVAEHRVIVSTCSSAGMLYGLGLSTRHFTHVFVDEVSQLSALNRMCWLLIEIRQCCCRSRCTSYTWCTALCKLPLYL